MSTPNLLRRQFILASLQTAIGLILGIIPTSIRAEWPQSRFAKQTFDTLWLILTAQETTTLNPLLALELPETAEDGASVPLQFSTTLSPVDSVHILVEKNPTPLIVQWQVEDGVLPYLGCRIKMAESCYVWVLARHQDQWLYNRRWVNVMKNGCGTG